MNEYDELVSYRCGRDNTNAIRDKNDFDMLRYGVSIEKKRVLGLIEHYRKVFSNREQYFYTTWREALDVLEKSIRDESKEQKER